MKRTVQAFNAELFRQAAKGRIPASGTFELTARCTLRCKMCYVCDPAEARKKELTAAQWIEIGRQARDAGLLYLLITGGEPMMRDDFKELYIGLQNLGLLITLNSNGTTITDEMADFLAAHPPLRVAITLYGAGPEAYKNVTGRADGFELARKGYERLRDRGVPCRLRTVLMPALENDIFDIARYIIGEGMPVGIVNYLMPCREENGNDPSALRYGPDELDAAERRLYNFLRELVKEKEAQKGENEKEAPPEKESEEPLIEKEDDEPVQVQIENDPSPFRCASGKYAFWITYDGVMTPCAILRQPSVRLGGGKSFSDAWKEMADACMSVPTCDDCAGCEDKKYCLVCPGRLFAETGAFDKKAEYLCRRAALARAKVDEYNAAK